jgi:hypothetical protein
LGLKEGAGTQHPEQKTKNLIQAFKNLSSRRSAGSALRTLHWSLATGVDELGKILGKFRHLKELIVSTDGTNNNFNVGLGLYRCFQMIKSR